MPHNTKIPRCLLLSEQLLELRLICRLSSTSLLPLLLHPPSPLPPSTSSIWERRISAECPPDCPLDVNPMSAWRTLGGHWWTFSEHLADIWRASAWSNWQAGIWEWDGNGQGFLNRMGTEQEWDGTGTGSLDSSLAVPFSSYVCL